MRFRYPRRFYRSAQLPKRVLRIQRGNRRLSSQNPFIFTLFSVRSLFYSGRPGESKTVGVEARIRPQYKDYVALDLSYNWDPLFHAVYQAEIILYAPLYQLSKRRPVGSCNRNLTLRQIYQNVERFNVMPLGRHTCLQP